MYWLYNTMYMTMNSWTFYALYAIVEGHYVIIYELLSFIHPSKLYQVNVYVYVEREMEKVPAHIPVLVLGNHRDMGHHRTVTEDKARYYCQHYDRLIFFKKWSKIYHRYFHKLVSCSVCVGVMFTQVVDLSITSVGHISFLWG